MRVLIGCEFSGVVREAMRRRGHDAVSCDLLPAEDGSPHHIQADVLTLLADHALSFWRKREGLILTLSRTDPLTGVHNRRSVMELLESEVARTLRHAPPLAVVILDMDFFKQVNDTWGHPTGDLVLKETARLLRETLRKTGRIGIARVVIQTRHSVP